MFRDNKGLSYIELILVIAIMTMMAGIATISMGMVNRNNINRASDKVISAFNEARSNALSKGSDNGWLNVTNKDGIIYYNIGKPISDGLSVDFDTQKWDKLTQSPIEFYVGSTTKLEDGETFSFQYKQSSGEYLGVKVDGSAPVDSSSVDADKKTVMLKNSSSEKSISLKIEKFSGKVSLL